MSVAQYPDAMNARNLQIWNNAAFDDGDSEDPSAFKAPSWSPVKALFVDRSESLESESCKENQSPAMGQSPISCGSAVTVKALQPNGVIGNSLLQPKPLKLVSRGLESESDENFRDEKMIDAEIEEIETEISRLSSRLEALRLERAERNAAKTTEKRGGRIIPAKFMDQNQKLVVKKIEEPMSVSKKNQRRAISMGPSEILVGARRGRVSIGPSEIVEVGKTQSAKKPEITPLQPIQNRRKSCFWKLQDIDERKPANERGNKCLSLSPKSRKTVSSKIQGWKPAGAATTVGGGRKQLKKEEAILSSIKPKKLFKDVEKSAVSSKKPAKNGRVVASRYSQITPTANSAIRKRSLPENVKEETKIGDKKRAAQDLRSESRVKKRWEIPSSLVIHKGDGEEENGGRSPSPVSQLPDLLPRIRIGRCNFKSPRDSGPARRVSELVGRKSFFCVDEEDKKEVPWVCQELNFAEAAEER